MLGKRATVVPEVLRTKSVRGAVQACGLVSRLLEDSGRSRVTPGSRKATRNQDFPAVSDPCQPQGTDTRPLIKGLFQCKQFYDSTTAGTCSSKPALDQQSLLKDCQA